MQSDDDALRPGPARVRTVDQGGDVGHRQGAGAQQAEEEGFARQNVPGTNQVLRHILLLPDRHHGVLRPDVPRPVHSGPRPRHAYCGLCREAC